MVIYDFIVIALMLVSDAGIYYIYMIYVCNYHMCTIVYKGWNRT